MLVRYVTTRNTIIMLGQSRNGLTVVILYVAIVRLTSRPAVSNGRNDKCHSLQLQAHNAHVPPSQRERIHAKHNYAEMSWEMITGV